MPTKFFICLDGHKIDVEDCLKEGGCRLKTRCAARTYLRMISTDREWSGIPSTTQLIAGTMLSFLRLTVPYAIRPDDCAFMAHGTKVHRKLETVPDELSLIEEKLTGETTGVTGIFDLLTIEDGRTILCDLKTWGSWRITKALGLYTADVETDEVFKSGKRKGQRKTRKWLFQSDDMIDNRDVELQQNMYRIQIEEMGWHVDEIRVMVIARDGGTIAARSRGIMRNVYYITINRLPDQEVRDYFERKRKNLLQALEQASWPDPCNELENWDGIRCLRYCPVWEHCVLGRIRHEERGEKMPIKGITDIPREQRGGKIRLGEMVTNEKGVSYPTEVDYFRMDPQTPDPNYRNQLIQEFQELFASEDGKVRSFRIVLPPYELDELFPQWRMRYTTGGNLACRGDGDTSENTGTAICYVKEHLRDLEKIEVDERGRDIVKCYGQDCPVSLKNKCKPQATLKILIPELCLDTWFITTGSINGMKNINDGIAKAQGISPGRWVPMILERVPEQKQHKGGKSRTHWIVHLRLAGTLKQFKEWSALTLADVTPDFRMLEEMKIEEVDIEMPADRESVPALQEPEITMDPVQESGQENLVDNGETLDEMTFHLAAELDVSHADFEKYINKATEEVGPEVVKETVRTTFGNEKKKRALLKKFTDWLKENPDSQHDLPGMKAEEKETEDGNQDTEGRQRDQADDGRSKQAKDDNSGGTDKPA